MKKSSVEAAPELEDGSLDFVFIDANHSYDAVKNDIIAWAPKVRSGGVLCGHDYNSFPGVQKAVDDFASAKGIRGFCTPISSDICFFVI